MMLLWYHCGKEIWLFNAGLNNDRKKHSGHIFDKTCEFVQLPMDILNYNDKPLTDQMGPIT